MAKKTTKEYSLEDYICGMSRDEFEENQLKLVEAKMTNIRKETQDAVLIFYAK